MANKGMRYYMNALDEMAQAARESDDYEKASACDGAIGYINYGHGMTDVEFLELAVNRSKFSRDYYLETDPEPSIAWREVIAYLENELAERKAGR